ncbi:hypothetical protein CQ018_13100 [Arthrobacter sp. MYb227]|uniref:hypothetical protein n=1 Tax=Arthrobacter sp. MYb227 TaxID=1848601 RepID=UPI000CFAB322|nr:hypothetical protein [Arthrobacter sp. MYb227]PQZ91576.1 hypothetical protein CQ018_13100 [Arthrobacter sp. MYb227]
MAIGMPSDPTLMELRIAGWSIEEIAHTYGVSELSVRGAFVQHFLRNTTLLPTPSRVGDAADIELD